MKIGVAEARPPSAPTEAASTAGSEAPALPATAANTAGISLGAGAAGDAGKVAASAPEMLDIEARVTVQVPKVKTALRALQSLAQRVGGVVTAERVDSSTGSGSAEMTLRVPSSAARSVLEELDQLGSVLDQNVTARDIGKDYFDANLRLASLETTLQRYQEILKQADKVDEILRIEAELARLRGEIEQVKGNLRWLQDRAARATLNLRLCEKAPELARPVEDPEPKLYPELRLPALLDFGKRKDEQYLGGGFSLRFSRALSLDLDLLRRIGSSGRGPDAALVTLGGEIHSDLLGGEQRRFFNPYLGWRAGYARFDSDNQALLGATLGLELYRSHWFGLDLEARNYLAFGGSRGGHYLAEPAFSARIAF